MKLSVIIPTWNRPEKLNNCLQSLQNQIKPPHEVVISCRPTDIASQTVISKFHPQLAIKIAFVQEEGVIEAENAALKIASGEIIAFIDDDACAPVDWLQKISNHFEQDSTLCAVGGPDLLLSQQASNYRVRLYKTVGKLTWYGKVIGNHHQRSIGIKHVDVLKGVNMAFRREYLSPLDINLSSSHSRGNGSQWELDLCLNIRKNKGKILFDPALEVRHDSDHSHFISYDNVKNNARNLTYVLLKHLPLPRKIVFLGYALLIGNTQLIGLAKFISHFIWKRNALINYYVSMHGLALGAITYFRRTFYNH